MQDLTDFSDSSPFISQSVVVLAENTNLKGREKTTKVFETFVVWYAIDAPST
jgi:hypothetical protein